MTSVAGSIWEGTIAIDGRGDFRDFRNNCRGDYYVCVALETLTTNRSTEMVKLLCFMPRPSDHGRLPKGTARNANAVDSSMDD